MKSNGHSNIPVNNAGSFSGRGSNIDFMSKNRAACGGSAMDVGRMSGSSSRNKSSNIGQAPAFGEVAGSASNKGSSSFMACGHNGVREKPRSKPHVKRRHSTPKNDAAPLSGHDDGDATENEQYEEE